jgi:hypothetical protein
MRLILGIQNLSSSCNFSTCPAQKQTYIFFFWFNSIFSCSKYPRRKAFKSHFKFLTYPKPRSIIIESHFSRNSFIVYYSNYTIFLCAHSFFFLSPPFTDINNESYAFDGRIYGWCIVLIINLKNKIKKKLFPHSLQFSFPRTKLHFFLLLFIPSSFE